MKLAQTAFVSLAILIPGLVSCNGEVIVGGLEPVDASPSRVRADAALRPPDDTSDKDSEASDTSVEGDDEEASLGNSGALGGSNGSACRAGEYAGTITGTYSSHITVVGTGVPLTGNVELTLDQEGSSNQVCSIDVAGQGVTSVPCSDVFTVSRGVITGAMDGLFPLYCTVTGTLDCARQILYNGWIECTYCAVGGIPDGGGGSPLAVCSAAGGNFAGVLQANYDTSTLSFTDGVWNGAEDLCTGIGGTSLESCNDGGSPGPEGGPPTNYLRSDGGYGVVANDYGGAGNWSAAWK